MARGAKARAAMVAAADLRLAEAGVPNPPRHADISRSDLSQPLHPDPGRAEEGADGAVAYCAADASPQEPQREEWTGTHPRYGLYPRAAGRDRGSRRAGSLGRRPPYRSERYAHRHTCRAQYALYDARQDCPQ